MSVEKYPNVATVRIIYNIYRQRPDTLFFEQAKKRDVGVIVRVPLASGLLTGKMRADTVFAADDHRAFNRNGEAFDKGETFAGVPYPLALAAVEHIRKLVPGDASMAQFALRWILMEESVSTVIPGARNAQQAMANTKAAELATISPEVMAELRALYRDIIAPHVHHLW